MEPHGGVVTNTRDPIHHVDVTLARRQREHRGAEQCAVVEDEGKARLYSARIEGRLAAESKSTGNGPLSLGDREKTDRFRFLGQIQRRRKVPAVRSA